MTTLPHPNKKTSTQQTGFIITSLVLLLILLLLGAIGIYTYQLNTIVQEKFKGKRWEIPAKVYARPFTMQQGMTLDKTTLINELNRLGYKSRPNYELSGSYIDQGNTVIIHAREFTAADIDSPTQIIKASFNLNTLTLLESTVPNPTGHAYLEPALIGGIYPSHNEDRQLIKFAEIPKPLIDTLLSTEDKNFYKHFGVSPRAIARAIVVKVTKGRSQGGSTITQQLVKNFYLTPERSLKRKVNEAIMAMLLEATHSKNDILETYMNEVNLGQSGSRSINGFALASQFYFGVPLQELKLSQMALLVGLANGPSKFNPWINPEAAMARRNIVINNLLKDHKINAETAQEAKDAPLGVVSKPRLANADYPEFLDLVKRQLLNEYEVEDLSGEGLKIYTTLDPIVQARSKASFESAVEQLANTHPKKPGKLQGAALIAEAQTGEVVCVIGGRGAFTGYNRALDAKRQVGSLLKPIVYLNAIASETYTAATPISDEAITIPAFDAGGGGSSKDWSPKNYDGVSHGNVPLITALGQSYNQATVRLGWEQGLNIFFDTAARLGLGNDLPRYPSVLLGAADLNPYDVLGMYQVFAAAGQRHNLHVIRSVTNSKGQVLKRFGQETQQVIKPSHAFVLNYMLQEVFNNGTAKAAYNTLSPTLKLAGKTGTTNNLRDSWFAGYSGNYVSVVWLGNDNNSATGLSGATGALPVWTSIMKTLPLKPVEFVQPVDIQWLWIDKTDGTLSAQECEHVMHVPLVVSSIPQQASTCAAQKYAAQQQPVIFDNQPDDPFDQTGDITLNTGDQPPPMSEPTPPNTP